jgi:hypothetical protein
VYETTIPLKEGRYPILGLRTFDHIIRIYERIMHAKLVEELASK